MGWVCKPNKPMCKKQSASCNAATIVIPMKSSETLPEVSVDAQGEDEEEDG